MKFSYGSFGVGALTIIALALIVIVVYWGNLRFTSVNLGAIAFFMTLCAGCIAGSVWNWKMGVTEFGELFGGAMFANAICTVFYGLAMTVEAVVNGSFGIGSFLLAFVAGPLLIAAASLPVALVQSAVIWSLRKAR